MRTLVDHTGTRRLGRTDPTVDLPDLTLEIYNHDPSASSSATSTATTADTRAAIRGNMPPIS
jgi:hypothetical protein